MTKPAAEKVEKTGRSLLPRQSAPVQRQTSGSQRTNGKEGIEPATWKQYPPFASDDSE